MVILHMDSNKKPLEGHFFHAHNDGLRTPYDFGTYKINDVKPPQSKVPFVLGINSVH